MPFPHRFPASPDVRSGESGTPAANAAGVPEWPAHVAGRRARRGWLAMLLAAIPSIGGCYTLRPVEGEPAPGTQLVVELSDRGRVALGDSIGPSANRIAGIVQPSPDSIWLLHVSSVEYLNGQSNKWAGEPLAVRRDLASRTRVREFSRSRTLAVGLGAAALVIALALTTDLFGSGTLGRTPGTPPPIEQ